MSILSNHVAFRVSPNTPYQSDLYSVSKNPPAVFWHFFPNGSEFLMNFLHT